MASGPSEDPDNSVGNIHDLIQFDSFTTISSAKKSEMMSKLKESFFVKKILQSSACHIGVSNSVTVCGTHTKVNQASTLESLNSGPLNSRNPLNNRQARLDQWIFH